jgi:hypothetical protein
VRDPLSGMPSSLKALGWGTVSCQACPLLGETGPPGSTLALTGGWGLLFSFIPPVEGGREREREGQRG